MYSLFTDEANLIFDRDGCYDGWGVSRGIRGGSFRQKWFSPSTACVSIIVFFILSVYISFCYILHLLLSIIVQKQTVGLTCPLKQSMDYDRVFKLLYFGPHG